jgi:7-alpha-hydroxysteroid dehydrogenase
MAETAPLHGYGVLITGGGTGIGKACAVDLASKGASVVICGRTEDRLKAVVSDLESRGLSAAHVVGDVTVEDDVHRAVEFTVAFAGNLKGVVANAGGGGGIGPYHLQDRDEYLRVLELNILGTMLCVIYEGAHFVKRCRRLLWHFVVPR